MVDIEALKGAVSEKTAAFMLTNPNTLGIFEKDVREIAGIVHDAGALLYYDGANLNAIMGVCRPGDMGFDIVHFNLHKSFATPHGGGGPGSGPVGVSERLSSFLPVPVVGYEDGRYFLDYSKENTIGKVHTFYGNIAVLVKAYAYIKMLGREGIRDVSVFSVLNSNYLRKAISEHLEVPYSGRRMHEFVASGRVLRSRGVKTLDLAKGMLDRGVHAPTVYFPLIVDEALMFEPTETEPISELRRLSSSVEEAVKNPEALKSAPLNASVRRVDDVKAAKNLILRWRSA